MINTALTCELNKVGSHFSIWRPFVSKLISNMSHDNKELVFVLFGGQAAMFRDDVLNKKNIIEVYHPAYYARKGIDMPCSIFEDINNKVHGTKIEW